MSYSTGEKRGKWNVVEASGRIDGATAPDLSAICKKEIDAGAIFLAVDMKEVTYMSSAGIRALFENFKILRSNSGALAIVSPPDNVKRVLELSGFTEIFTIVASLDELS